MGGISHLLDGFTTGRPLVVRLVLLALLTLLVALLARRLVLLVLLTRLPIPQTDTTTQFGSTEGALSRSRTKSRFSLSQRVASGEPGKATQSTPSSLPLGGKTILAQDSIMRVETEEPDQLLEPGEGWISLDRKLAAAITNIARGEIGREITQHNTTALLRGQVVRGRVLLAIVYRHYASGTN